MIYAGYMTHIREFCAWHMRQIHAGCAHARHIHESDANVARGMYAQQGMLLCILAKIRIAEQWIKDEA
jgi:hypothetical protein